MQNIESGLFSVLGEAGRFDAPFFYLATLSQSSLVKHYSEYIDNFNYPLSQQNKKHFKYLKSTFLDQASLLNDLYDSYQNCFNKFSNALSDIIPSQYIDLLNCSLFNGRAVFISNFEEWASFIKEKVEIVDKNKTSPRRTYLKDLSQIYLKITEQSNLLQRYADKIKANNIGAFAHLSLDNLISKILSEPNIAENGLIEFSAFRLFESQFNKQTDFQVEIVNTIEEINKKTINNGLIYDMSTNVVNINNVRVPAVIGSRDEFQELFGNIKLSQEKVRLGSMLQILSLSFILVKNKWFHINPAILYNVIASNGISEYSGSFYDYKKHLFNQAIDGLKVLENGELSEELRASFVSKFNPEN